jgi:Chalcone isomerase-like
MRTVQLSVVALALVAAFAASALAGEKAGIKMPDSIEVAGKKLALNGMGLREATWLDIDVYVAGLYLETVSSDPATIINSQQIKRLTLRFVRDVDRDDILKAWHSGFKNNATVKVETLKANMDQLDKWMSKFNDGHSLTFTYVPEQGVEVNVNGKVMGTLKGADFANSLFAIWLGPKPPNNGLKKGLLGKHPAAKK